MGVRRFFKNMVRDAVRQTFNEQMQCDVTPPRNVVYLGNDLLLTTTRYGHKMFLVASDRSLTPHIALDGYWEQWITDVFRRIVQPGMHVVDVGANVGYYTMLAAQAVGETGRVTAFEANPALADVVHRNMDVNGFLGRVEIVSKAAYSEVAELNFSIYRNYKGSSGLWGSNEDAAIFRDQVDVISVPAVPLDVQLAGQKVDFLKIDAEGAEGHILLGAQRLIAENPGLQLLIEYAPRFIASCFESVDRFHDLLQRYGLEPHVVNHDATLTKMTFSELAASGIQHCDVVLRRKV